MRRYIGSPSSRRLWQLLSLTAVIGLVGSTLLSAGLVSPAAAATSMCGQTGTGNPIKHVVIVMLENHSYKQVVGNSSAPFQTNLAKTCGVATAMFGVTHTSAVNYLALSAGRYPANSPRGCGSVASCRDGSDNLYNQLAYAGLNWRSYVESMPSACSGSTAGQYKIGHNPAIFYSDINHANCQLNDVPDNTLTSQSGPLWDDLNNQTLPALAWVTPNLNNDGEGPGGAGASERAADNWLAAFVNNLTQSPSYAANDTALLITYDEGTGSDSFVGEDCTNQSRDMPVSANGVSAHQDSCHVPFFVVYPNTPSGTQDATFFDHYSVTKTIEDIFGLPYLAHAGDSQTNSLIGHFGL